MLSGILGNAKEITAEEAKQEVGQMLLEKESIEKAYKLIRDTVIFTDKRLILVDKQGVTGKKVEYFSIPYKSITHFSIETAGNFDMDSELKIWIKGTLISKQFKKGEKIEEVQKLLSSYVLT